MENVETGVLPPGWAWARLGDVCLLNPGLDLDGINSDVLLPFVGMASVEALTNRVDVSQARPLSEVATGFTRFRAGDVLFAKITPCMENGKIAVVPDAAGSAAFGSTEFHVLRPRNSIDKQYLHYYLVQQSTRDQARAVMSGAVGQQRVPKGFLQALLVPLPPAMEQRRLVELIDKLFTEIEEAEAAMKRARRQMADYRASLLHAACTGALTANWRGANPRPAEDGPALLRRILAERRAAWERSELARLTAAGKVPRGEGWKRRYPEPVAIDSELLDPLPSTWTWASLDQLTSVITSGSRAWSPYYGRGTGTFIMAQNVRLGRFNPIPRQLVDPPFDDSERKRTAVERDDVLVTIVGANTGDACRIDTNLVESYVCQSVGLLRPVNASISAFLEAYLIAPSGGQAAFKQMMYGAGRPHLSFDQLRSVPIPLPPPHEQAQIVVEVRDHEIDIPSEETGATQVGDELIDLRQSILHAAFSGRLVPQDPADEPATTLLARLCTEAAPSTSRRTTRTKVARP